MGVGPRRANEVTGVSVIQIIHVLISPLYSDSIGHLGSRYNSKRRSDMRSLLLAITLAVLVPASASAASTYTPPKITAGGGMNISTGSGHFYVPGPRQQVCTTNLNGYRTCY
jgi:hypothetical protein